MRVIGAVARVPAPTREQFEERFVLRERPVILTGGLERWPALQRWSPEALRARLGAVRVRYKHSRGRFHPDFDALDPAVAFATREASFAEFLDALAAPGAASCFLTGDEEPLLRVRSGPRGRQVSSTLATLLEDFELPPYFDPERIYTVWTWFSAAGVRTWLHYDNNGCHNLNAQVRGEKQFWLFPPTALDCFYPFELGAVIPAHNCSRVNVEQPDYARFPRFREATCLEGELREGDLLFLPAFWLHSFLHVGRFNANVNFWWRPESLALNPVSQRWAWLQSLASALRREPSEGAGPDPADLARLSAETRELLSRVDSWTLGAHGS
jgi:lysine-specific demethylase 8